MTGTNKSIILYLLYQPCCCLLPSGAEGTWEGCWACQAQHGGGQAGQEVLPQRRNPFNNNSAGVQPRRVSKISLIQYSLHFIVRSGLCQFECPTTDVETQGISSDCLESSCCRERQIVNRGWPVQCPCLFLELESKKSNLILFCIRWLNWRLNKIIMMQLLKPMSMRIL